MNLIPLTFFSELYQSAKSSISEDLTIVKETFEEKGTGKLMTVPGAAGGVKFIPKMADAEVREVMSLLNEGTWSFGSTFTRWIFVYDGSYLGNPVLWIVSAKYLLRRFADHGH